MKSYHHLVRLYVEVSWSEINSINDDEVAFVP